MKDHEAAVYMYSYTSMYYPAVPKPIVSLMDSPAAGFESAPTVCFTSAYSTLSSQGGTRII